MHRSFVHLELNTDDIERARAFYREVFGWAFDDVAIEGHTYTQINTPQPPAGGIQVKPSADLPSHWMPYIAVGDVRKAVARARGAGARIVTDYSATPGHGALAILRDPSGAVFGVWQVESDPRPEPGTVDTDREWNLGKKRTGRDSSQARGAGLKSPRSDASEPPAPRASAAAPTLQQEISSPPATSLTPPRPGTSPSARLGRSSTSPRLETPPRQDISSPPLPRPNGRPSAGANGTGQAKPVSVALERNLERAKADAMNQPVAKTKSSKKQGKKTVARGKAAASPKAADAPRLKKRTASAGNTETPNEAESTAEPVRAKKAAKKTAVVGRGFGKKASVVSPPSAEPPEITEQAAPASKKGGGKKKAAEAPLPSSPRKVGKKGSRKTDAAPSSTWDEITGALEAVASRVRAQAKSPEPAETDAPVAKKTASDEPVRAFGKKKAAKTAAAAPVEPSSPRAKKIAKKTASAPVEPSSPRAKKIAKKTASAAPEAPSARRKLGKKQTTVDDAESKPRKKLSKRSGETAAPPSEWKTSKKKGR